MGDVRACVCVCLRLLYFLGCSFVILVRAWVRVCVAGRVSGGLREHNSNVGAERGGEREAGAEGPRGGTAGRVPIIIPRSSVFLRERAEQVTRERLDK